MNVRRLATSLPVLTSAALTVVAALVAAPANAETHITQDAVQDVASGAGVKINTPEPDRSEGDLTSMRVKHGGRHLNITLNYVELSKVTGRNTMIHLIAVRSDTRGRADLFDYVQSNKGGQGRTDFYVRGSDGRCPAVRTKIDYAKFLMRASIPNKCLGNPE